MRDAEFRQLFLGQWEPTQSYDDEVAAEMERIIEETLAREALNKMVNEVNDKLAVALLIPRKYLNGDT